MICVVLLCLSCCSSKLTRKEHVSSIRWADDEGNGRRGRQYSARSVFKEEISISYVHIANGMTLLTGCRNEARKG